MFRNFFTKPNSNTENMKSNTEHLGPKSPSNPEPRFTTTLDDNINGKWIKELIRKHENTRIGTPVYFLIRNVILYKLITMHSNNELMKKITKEDLLDEININITSLMRYHDANINDNPYKLPEESVDRLFKIVRELLIQLHNIAVLDSKTSTTNSFIGQMVMDMEESFKLETLKPVITYSEYKIEKITVEYDNKSYEVFPGPSVPDVSSTGGRKSRKSRKTKRRRHRHRKTKSRK
jgi:hypothetical protein